MMTVIMSIEETPEGLDRAVVTLAGSAAVNDGGELKAALLGGLASDELFLDLGGLTAADSAILQLVLSARRTAEATGKRMLLSPEPSVEFIEAARAAGFRGADMFETVNSVHGRGVIDYE
jgi:anti-anti-sigma regulatory factor